MGSATTVPPNQILKPSSFRIPSDISSAAFLIAIGILSSDKIVLNKVLINERRIGFLKILKRMNANITISNITEVGNELIGDIEVIKSELIATQIEPDEIPDLIDEIPLLTFLASQAEGETTLRGAEELRIKEGLDNAKAKLEDAALEGTKKTISESVTDFGSSSYEYGKKAYGNVKKGVGEVYEGAKQIYKNPSADPSHVYSSDIGNFAKYGYGSKTEMMVNNLKTFGSNIINPRGSSMMSNIQNAGNMYDFLTKEGVDS
jgi:hypothetical protein